VEAWCISDQKTSQPHPAHPVFPYLLKGWRSRVRTRSGCSDITFIQSAGVISYLVAIMDWATRKVLSFGGCPIRCNADFCVDALQEAIGKYGPPEIMIKRIKKA